MDHGEHSSGDRGSDPVTSSGAFRIIGSGGAHGIGREMLCSLPRAVSCRVCFGEKDCPYIVERPYGRLVVRKRPPTDLVVRHVATVATGSRNPVGTWTPLWQKAAALLDAAKANPPAGIILDLQNEGLDLPAYLSQIERDLVRRSLERTGGNRNKAAALLRINRTTLVEKLKRLGTH